MKYQIFADIVDPKAIEQMESAMAQPYAVKGALMPDVHAGYALPIGAVVATKDMIVPSWVGYDIGCGVCALATSFKKVDVLANTSEIHANILEMVPVGQRMHQPAAHFYEYENLTALGKRVYEARHADYQLGTLGSGNHFIEVGYDDTDQVWIIIHSGSRGFGHGLATEYMKIAANSDKPLEGHYPLPVTSADGKDYLTDSSIALKYALYNRELMLRYIVKAMGKSINGEGSFDGLINRNHNHVEFSNGLWVHRKGATHAEEGMLGVIPGNMRDGSFIVEGKGNSEYLCSSSHGAGRVLGRNQAFKTLNVTDFEKAMEGITAQVGRKTLDESPMAYKDIFKVMEQQQDTVKVVAHIKPMINVKG